MESKNKPFNRGESFCISPLISIPAFWVGVFVGMAFVYAFMMYKFLPEIIKACEGC